MKKLAFITLSTLFVFSACKKEEILEPEACFQPSRTEWVQNYALEFTNCSSNADTYFWDFGDQSTSIAESPSHIYSDTGTYTVVLQVETDDGKIDRTEHQVRIGDVSISKIKVLACNLSGGKNIIYWSYGAYWDFTQPVDSSMLPFTIDLGTSGAWVDMNLVHSLEIETGDINGPDQPTYIFPLDFGTDLDNNNKMLLTKPILGNTTTVELAISIR